MTFGSLFTGIGGLDLGLERAGMECKWQVEIDDYCRRVLAKHWPDVPKYGDIREIQELPYVDLICGGFPCQPFSSAAHGNNTHPDLWPEMYRVVALIKPTWVVAENVPRIDGPSLESVVADLETGGYEVGILEVPACAFGFDHRRSRYWILGYSDSDGQSSGSIHAEVAGVSRRRGESRGVGAENGIPKRMDRLRALGNAVVPQCAHWIGRRIMESAMIEEGKK